MSLCVPRRQALVGSAQGKLVEDEIVSRDHGISILCVRCRGGERRRAGQRCDFREDDLIVHESIAEEKR